MNQKPRPPADAPRHKLSEEFLHDLRTPLNHIIGYSEMLAEQAEEEGQTAYVPDLQEIHGAAQQLLALLKSGEPLRDEVLPASKSTQATSATPSLAMQPGAEPAWILVVDDVERNRDLLSRRLSKEGHTVVTAENGREALEAVRIQPFDLVLLDIMMPEIDGYEVLQQLQADESLRHIPVIMISALDELDGVARCIEMGAEDYLPKPFNPTLLKARIGACLGKKRAHEREAELFAELRLRYRQLEELHEKIRLQAEHLQELSIRDALTRLYNRRHFDEQAHTYLAHATRYAQPLTIMIGDIDFFKRINDGFSHAMGDEVLRQVALLLLQNTRESDIVARYGGEEFAIALPATPLSQAVVVCDKLRSLIESHSWHKMHTDLHVTMSMGVSTDTSLGSLDKMMAVADEKLYQAKTNGRNRVCTDGYESLNGTT